MKIRKGFVSNSSSSSFLIAYKSKHGPHKRSVWEEAGPNFSKLLEQNGVSKDSSFGNLLHRLLRSVWDSGRRFATWEAWTKDRRGDWNGYTDEELSEWDAFEDGKPVNVKKLLEDGWTICVGSIESCGELGDFHDIAIDHEDDSLIFKHRGGH